MGPASYSKLKKHLAGNELVTIYHIFEIFPSKNRASYVKLQDAFTAETGAYYGSWDVIGYAIGKKGSTCDNSACSGTTNNFEFAQAGSYDADKHTAALSATATTVWTANNKVKLNDCVQGTTTANWVLKVSQASGSSAGEYQWTAKAESTCKGLTPNFESLGTAN